MGVRCPECGKATKIPVYIVSRRQFALALLISIVIGILGGVLVAMFLRPILPSVLYVASIAGFAYILSEAVSVVSNHRRGLVIQIVSVSGVVVAMVTIIMMSILLYVYIGLFDFIAAGLGIYVVIIRLR